ncbi:MAG: 2-keto-4-pentenoate hydratase [Steroidobacter sp.]
MSNSNKPADSDSGIAGIANRFVAARRQHRALDEFPGTLPATLEDAYRCQDRAIKSWPDDIGGWKVGMIGGQFQIKYKTDRLVGPIFRSSIVFNIDHAVNRVPVFINGFGAVEAEFVFRIGKDAPGDKIEWTRDEAVDLVESLHAGVEIASSPLATINDLGPASIISDFGNNNGLIVGASIDHWSRRLDESLICSTTIDDMPVGTGNATSIPGGPMSSLMFALSMCASRGFPLRAGQYVCTGAVTGVHRIFVQQRAHITFADIDAFQCLAVASGAEKPANP